MATIKYIKEVTISDGGSWQVDVNDGFEIYRMTGTAVLTGNYSVTYNGTPAKDTYLQIIYRGEVTLGGNSITILGAVMPTQFADKNFIADCIYNGTSWDVKYLPDFEEAGIVETDDLADGAVTTVKIPDNNVTLGKIAQAAANTIIANPTAALADNQALAISDESIIARTGGGNIAPLVVAAGRVVGRTAAGNLAALTAAELRTLADVPQNTLADATIWVGSAAAVPTSRTPSGDLTMTNTGAFTIANDAVTTVKILDANVTTDKVADGAITTAKVSSTSAEGVAHGPVVLYAIAASDFLALLDTGTNNLLALEAGDFVARCEVYVSVAGGAGLIDIGCDANVRAIGAATDGILQNVDASAIAPYTSDNATYNGTAMGNGGLVCDASGYLTVTSSVDYTTSAFVGRCFIWVMKA